MRPASTLLLAVMGVPCGMDLIDPLRTKETR